MEWKNNFLNYLFVIFTLICGALLFFSFREEKVNLILMVASSVFILAFLISLFILNKKGLSPETKYIVQFDGIFISCYYPDRRTESVKWNEIAEVFIVTTDKGSDKPFIWILLNSDTGKGCIFPIGAKNSREVVEKILGMEGCDLKKWGEAIKSTGNNKFLVWKSQLKYNNVYPK